MSGNLVVSLDFELMWGVRDHRSLSDYGDAVLGGRQAIPLILERFERAGIRATWATVGLLFAKSRDQMLEYAPDDRPRYENPALSPYSDIEKGLIGDDEASDPYHFGASLIDRIASTPGQEIASHTYSHYYCMEPGASVSSFRADLSSAKLIAENFGQEIRSLVFPRNQARPEFIEQAKTLNFSVYRGDAQGSLYRSRSGVNTTRTLRLARFIDGAVPIGPPQVGTAETELGSVNIPASRFLRPWRRRTAIYNRLHVKRVLGEMLHAAKIGGCYHLWWHPHNFGREPAQNLRQLDEVIAQFIACRDSYGMTSRSMNDFSVLTPD